MLTPVPLGTQLAWLSCNNSGSQASCVPNGTGVSILVTQLRVRAQ